MSDYADGELALPKQRRVDEHLGICSACRRLLANMRPTVEALGRLRRSTPPGAEDVETVSERMGALVAGQLVIESSRRSRDAWAERFERSMRACAYRPGQARYPLEE